MSGGFFLTLEGGEGAGKSTLARHLAQTLTSTGREVILTREPGGTQGAEAIRDLLVRDTGQNWQARTELLLVCAARAEHLTHVIRPALTRGALVVCDRYIDSTRAYQGSGGLDRQVIDAANALIDAPLPDLTLWLDLPARMGLERSRGGSLDEDRFERMGLARHEAIAGIFAQIAAAEPQRVKRLDAQLPAPDVFAQALAYVEAALAEQARSS